MELNPDQRVYPLQTKYIDNLVDSSKAAWAKLRHWNNAILWVIGRTDSTLNSLFKFIDGKKVPEFRASSEKNGLCLWRKGDDMGLCNTTDLHICRDLERELL